MMFTVSARVLGLLGVASPAIALPAPLGDGHALAKAMNNAYHSYDPLDDASGTGVYLRMSETAEIFCHKPCFQGKPDCKISGSLFNDQVMRDQSTGAIAVTFGKAVAWYVDSTKVHEKLAKCTFAWDGGTDAKLNGGCGCNPGVTTCDNHGAAYHDLCDGVPCTSQSQKVKSCECTQRDPSSWPKSWEHAPECFWKGAAFYPPDGNTTDETHLMLKQRVKSQANKGAPPRSDNYIQWNEMVLDGDLLLKEMETDPSGTIPAIVYIPDVHGEAYAIQAAKKTAQAFRSKFPYGSYPLPLIKIDSSVNVLKGGDPFVFDNVYAFDTVTV